jgi:hypothetical protein
MIEIKAGWQHERMGRRGSKSIKINLIDFFFSKKEE